MNNELGPTPVGTPASRRATGQSFYGDLEYVSLELEGQTYGGWYRLLADGRLELLALANMQRERRTEGTPAEQARRMLEEFIHAARAQPAQANTAATATAEASAGRQNQDVKTTLGDILYGDTTRTTDSEDIWTELVRATAGGDQHALHELFERTHRIVFTLILRLTHDQDTAEKLTVDVFYDVWRHAPKYGVEDHSSVIAWIMKLAHSRALQAPQASLAASASSVRTALAELTTVERHAVESACVADGDWAQFVKRLQLAPSAVRTRLHSGLARLRRALNPGSKA